MAIPYRTLEECNDRLVRTVIFYGEDPVYVFNAEPVNGGVNIGYLPLPLKADLDELAIRAGKVEWAPCSDPKWRAHDLLVGYVNGERTKKSYYLTRMPLRKWKQGLTQENLLMPRGDVGWAGLCKAATFRDMLINKYPSFRAAKGQITNLDGMESRGIAFHRHLSVYYDQKELFWLHYRGDAVASSHDGDVFHLPSKRKYLQEFLEAQDIAVKTKA